MTPESERIADDPRLLGEARLRYRGAGPLEDQLWWLRHPGLPTPAGLADPLHDAELAWRDLYRRGAPGEDGERIGAARASALADRTAAETAVRETLAEHAPVEREAPPPTVAAPGARPAAAAARARPWFARWPVLLGALAVIAALVIAAVATRQHRTDPYAVPAFAVFDRTTRPFDHPVGSSLPSLTRNATTRHLATYSSIGLDIFGIRRPNEQICLLVIVLGEQSTAVCTTTGSFEADGLVWVGLAEADPVDDRGTRPSPEVRVTWAPDGTLRVDPSTSV